MNELQDVMGVLEKLQSLLKSRRFWLYAARLVVSLIVIATFIAPMLGFESPDVPDEEQLADDMAKALERVANIIGAVVGLLALIIDGKQITADFTTRPPGVDDRGSTYINNITYTES